ncbi:MAG: methionine biosynthesis protein MetW [Candidatus Aminicenantes bacterium]|jgi:O-antigen chain-terminating methyltransferase
MKRTIEKLAKDREDKEAEFIEKIAEIRKQVDEFKDPERKEKLQQLVARLEDTLTSIEEIPTKKGKRPFSKPSKKFPEGSSHKGFDQQALLLFKELEDTVDRCSQQIEELSLDLAALAQSSVALIDAKDKEWDALSNNHVAMIFKSLEWRVDQLEAKYKDANMLMKRFLDLKEKLTELTATLDEKHMPTPGLVGEILQPLEDWRYTGFENRFRGSEAAVKSQLQEYLPFFKKGKKVVDLGCGRGEFLDLLKSKWIDAEGIDINEQMVNICKDKGLACRRGDILEQLAEYSDASLGGIFASQVIEHLPPSYLRRLIEVGFVKLAPSAPVVLETINPASVFALVEIYHLDISHKQPIHPQALKFLLESSGFEDVTIRYGAPLEQEMLKTLPGADEHAALLNQNIDSLNKLLYGPPNYAAIGYKR